MNTNILATILTLMVTNAPYDPADREPKFYQDNMPVLGGGYFNLNYHAPYDPADREPKFYQDNMPVLGGGCFNPNYHAPDERTSKTLVTDVYENRLLILEAEGQSFTNILASKFHHQIRETFRKEVVAPKWVSEQTVINTNDPNALMRVDGTTNYFVRGNALFLTNTSIYLTLTNEATKPKDK